MPYVYVEYKQDFPPLLQAGLWPKTLDELRALCVDAFPRSDTRVPVMCGLEHIVAMLAADGIVGNLWVDGSFLTEKDDPDDTDLVLELDGAFADGMTIQQRETIAWFQDRPRNLKRFLRAHCFAITRYPPGHSRYWTSEYEYAYWLRQWGFTREDPVTGQISMKGVAVVELR